MYDIFKSIISYWSDSLRFYRTVRELNSLSDRELSDLGITRGNITYIAMNSTLANPK